MLGAVLYNADEGGYRIFVTRGGRIIDEYWAGNNLHDSQAMALPGDPSEPKSALLKYARQTALEMANEMAEKYNISRDAIAVTRDKDICVAD